mmetsp:Transcript_49406/g.131112  ORF Transcript_49406/g.131112 Transcript_49406/m.131112 type:complete len:343 (+) Transcript_49406:470-1498(+)
MDIGQSPFSRSREPRVCENLPHGRTMTLVEDEQFPQQISRSCSAPKTLQIRAKKHLTQIVVEFHLGPALRRTKGVRVALNRSAGLPKCGGAPAKKPPEATTQRPHVAPARETSLDHFGSHRRDGTTSVGRVECLSLACWKHLGETPVDDNCLWWICGREHQVIELQVLVHNSSRVSIGDPFAHLLKDVVGPVLRYRSESEDLIDEELEHGAALQQVCDDVDRVCIRIVLEDANNGRMIQFCEPLGLLHNENCSHPMINCILLEDGLHTTTGLPMPAVHEVDHTEDALTNHLCNLVVLRWPTVTLSDACFACKSALSNRTSRNRVPPSMPANRTPRALGKLVL